MLLGILRNRARSIFIYVAFGIIIVVFIFFFGWGELPGRHEGWVVKVNDQPVSYNTYTKHYNRLLDFYQRMYKDKLDGEAIEKLGLKQKAVDSLVENTVLLQLAKKTRITTPRAEVEKTIREAPVFQNDGQFDFKKYEQLLRANRITPEEFEAQQGQEATVAMIRNFVLDGTKHSDAELWEEYKRQNEKINLEFLEIIPDSFEKGSTINEEQIKKHYEDNKEAFRFPDRIKLNYVEISPKNYEKDVEVSDQQLAEYYRDFSEEFWQPKKVHARHILIKMNPKAQPAEREGAKKKAEEVLGMIKDGKSFEEMAKQYSQDSGSAPSGGDLGFFPRGQMVKPFEDEAFKLKPGEVSNVIETQFGFHIIRVEEVREEGTEPLEAVKEKIRGALIEEGAKEMSKGEAHRAYRALLKNKDMKECAKNASLRLVETAYFSREETPPPFGESKEIMEEIFSLTPEEIAYPLFIGNSYFLVKVVDKQKSHVPGLEEVRGKIELFLQKQKQMQAAKQKAETLLKELRAGKPIDAVAMGEKMSLKETGLFTRGALIPNIGASPELMAMAFALSPERPYPDKVFELNERVYLVRLKAREDASPQAMREKKGDVEKKYAMGKKGKYFEDWLKNARLHSSIVFSPRFTP